MHDTRLDDYYWSQMDACTLPININDSPLNELQLMTWYDTHLSHMIEAIEKYAEIKDPFFAYARCKEYVEFYVFASPANSKNNFSRYLMQLTEITQMIKQFKIELKDIIDQAHAERVPAPAVNIHPDFNYYPLLVEIEGALGPAKFTAKEFEVLNLVVKGYSNAHIAKLLNRSERTIETHLSSMKDKTGFSKKSQLISEAINQLYTLELKSSNVSTFC